GAEQSLLEHGGPSRCHCLRPLKLYIARAGGDQPFFAVIVHSIDEIAETLVHEFTFDFTRRRHRLALLFRVERLRQDAERLDLLDARKIAVNAVNLSTHQPFNLRMRGKAGEPGVADIVGARPVGDGSKSISMTAVRYLRPCPNTTASAT